MPKIRKSPKARKLVHCAKCCVQGAWLSLSRNVRGDGERERERETETRSFAENPKRVKKVIKLWNKLGKFVYEQKALGEESAVQHRSRGKTQGAVSQDFKKVNSLCRK